MARLTRLAPLFLLVALGGCVSQAEMQQQIAESHRQSCLTDGFKEGTDNYKLCLLLQETNRRIDALNGRVAVLEANTRWVNRYGPFYYPP